MFPNTRKLIVATTAIAAFAWLATPADAQRGGGHQQSGARSSGGQTQSHQAAPPQHAAPQAQRQAPPPQAQRQAPPQQQRQEQPQTQRQSPQQVGPSQRFAPQNDQRRQIPNSTQRFDQRSASGARVVPPNAALGPRAEVRTAPFNSRDFNSRDFRAGDNRFQSRGFGGARIDRRPVFVRPYYVFRPRFNLGFGLFAGYAISYPWSYYDPYGYYNYSLGFGPDYYYSPSYGASYYETRVGGLSFDVDPVDAAVYVDGQYVGEASDFSSAQMPLTVSAGRHRVELRAQGFLTISFDVSVLAGQVIPYEGTMQIIR